MFTDTHFHIKHLAELGINLTDMFSSLAKMDFGFVMDIGTECDDTDARINIAFDAIDALKDDELKQKAKNMIFFSSGIWPSPEAIKGRSAEIKTLENFIQNCSCKEKLIAIGECGLDHHHNANGADSDELCGEEELFEMQIDLAKKLRLPLIVHSREAFDETISCIKNMGYNRGEVHCFSYDKHAAKAFLDLGYYLAFGGAVTYAKKDKLDEIKDLICYVPRDRLLLETDAPYLAPLSNRGKTNTPLLITETYQFIADILSVDVATLANSVFDNATCLFLSKRLV